MFDTPDVPECAVMPASAEPLPCAVVITADARQHVHLVQRMLDEAGLTPDTAADQLGVRPQSIRQYLTGRRGISLPWLVRLATLCRCAVAIHLRDPHASGVDRSVRLDAARPAADRIPLPVRGDHDAPGGRRRVAVSSEPGVVLHTSYPHGARAAAASHRVGSRRPRQAP